MGRKRAEKRRKKRNKRPRPELSLCMIAKDEGDFLRACLASVNGLADEIVVGDTGSSDDTVEVAQQAGARVVPIDWTGDFAAARNQALKAVRGRWVLVLDCDEVLGGDDRQALRRLLQEGRADAYRLTTRNYTRQTDRDGWVPCRGEAAEEKDYPGWYPTTKVRLWRHHPKIVFEGAVHELVEASLQRLGKSIADCPVPVHHYGSAEKVRAPDRYLSGGQEKVQARPNDLRALFEVAIAYREAGRLDEALQAIEQVVSGDSSEKELYLDRAQVLLVYGDILDRRGQLDQALAVYRRVIALKPDAYQAFNNGGNILERQGLDAEAVGFYRRGIQVAPENPVLAKNLSRLEARAGLGASGGRRLSACLIVRDEEKTLGRCLQSLAGVADEVVVVDTGSTDQTLALAQRFGARIGHFTWCDDYAAARNASLELARGEWILWLDADEYLTPLDREKVIRAKSHAPDQAFYFTLVNEGGDGTRFRQVKMFPNRPTLRFERPVHETLVPALRRVGLAVASADIEVRHTGYSDPQAVGDKQAYYLRLMEKWLASHPNDFDICFRIGHTHYSQGRYGPAASCFERILTQPRPQVEPDSVWRLALGFKGRCLLEKGDYQEAADLLRPFLQEWPDDAIGNLTLGDALSKSGDWEGALPFLEAASAAVADPFFPLDENLIRYSALFFKGQCLTHLGRRQEAMAALQAAVGLCPERAEATQMLEHLESRPKKEASRPRLTLCMIVRNEEQRLGRCLESARGVVDEIVVVDTGSTDATEEVARGFGARIGHFPWCDDFAAARNVSLEMATGDWILWLDADDILPDEYHNQIRRLIEAGTDKSYFFVLDDQGFENVSCLQLRLFPNLPGVGFEMPVHEQVTPSLQRLGVGMVPTDIRVIHTGYTTPEVVKAKKARYLAIMEAWLKEHPQDYIVRSHVALTYHTTGRLEEALAAYRTIVEASACLSDNNLIVYTTAVLFLGRTYLKMKEYTKALEYIEKARQLDPDYVLTKVSLAEIHLQLGHFDQVKVWADAVLEGGVQLSFFPVDQREVEYSAHLLRAQACQALGHISAAENSFLQAGAVEVPRRAEALGLLAELYKKNGQFESAEQTLERACQLDPENFRHHFNLGVFYLERGQSAAAQTRFSQVVKLRPDFGPALLNLGYIARASGEEGAAEKLYLQLLGIEPDNLEAKASLAHLYLGGRRLADAETYFGQIRSQEAGLLDVNLGLLAAISAQGRWDDQLAQQVLEPFAELERSDGDWQQRNAATAFVGLALALVQRNVLKCAELACAVALAVAPEEGAALRTKAEIHFRQKDYWQALAQWEAMLLTNPRDGEAFRRLGDCYRALGVGEAAQMCYERSRQVAGG